MTSLGGRAVPNLAAALVKAQGEFPAIEKRRTAKIGQSFSYKYADLSDVLQGVGPALRKNGLVLIFGAELQDAAATISATILHESGEWITANLPLVADNDPKQTGSRITYLKRYLAGLLTGVATDDDDDGEAASQARRSSGKPKGNPEPAKSPEGSGEAAPAAVETMGSFAAKKKAKAVVWAKCLTKLDDTFGKGGLYDKKDGTDELTQSSRDKLKVLSLAFGTTKVDEIMALENADFKTRAVEAFLPAITARIAEKAASGMGAKDAVPTDMPF